MSNRAKNILGVALIALVGIWGCARQPGSASSADAERIKALEAKNARLMDDYRTAAAARDQLRKGLAAAEQLYAQTRLDLEQLQSVVQERDELRNQVAAIASERDSAQVQFEEFRNQIKQLLGQAETAARQPTKPIIAVGPQLSMNTK